MAVKIVTDSSADIPAELVKEYGIGVVPLNVHFGDEVLKDGFEIRSEEFYHRLKTEAVLPRTSQPAPGEFLKVYREIADPGDAIISLHISADMSGTAGSAQIAADMLGDEYQVEVIDSRFVCMVLGMIVLRAAKMVKAGADVAVVIDEIKKIQNQIVVYFTVNSLDYLSRNGRIGKATAFLGSLLNIKPILGIENGIIVPIEKVRGNFPKVAKELVAKIAERYGDESLEICVIHTEIPNLAEILKQEAASRLQVKTSLTTSIGPIGGTHAGPYTLGIIGLPA